MHKKERQSQIEKLIQEKGSIQTLTLCRLYNITEMTVRRDFDELQKRKVLIRTHGGAIAMEKKTYDAQTPLLERLKTATKEKEDIALCARSHIVPGEAIFLGSGSTIDVFASSLLEYTRLTILTDALNIANKLYTDVNLHIIVLGGELRSKSFTLTGRMSEQNLRQFRIKHAFISVNGIDEEGTLYVSSIVESGLLEILFQQVDELFVLADSSKLNKKDLVKITATKSFTLITSKEVNSSIVEHYRSNGIHVIQAN